MSRLAGKIAVITGGNSGIGLAAARRFAQEGAQVVITGRRQKELDEAIALIGHEALAIQGDVSKLADLERIFSHIQQVKGKVDVLFANAGLGELFLRWHNVYQRMQPLVQPLRSLNLYCINAKTY
ncbi:SDR family NAD(P)-dependent oxidoreductase [Serratia rubidaea]|uniref:SDR family NAD(P)-dependent oxidoreductase n=1 Tax=Serratia rubidaea TaxID=61652 RepID=UPI00234A4DDA|nr:SDR family NAD(P)-dependent oxidoreductase [Serratia rubidaea]MDC6110799.1 SDR family NAD(P)-dependent oxidoreductase [Serratia rubidaea]